MQFKDKYIKFRLVGYLAGLETNSFVWIKAGRTGKIFNFDHLLIKKDKNGRVFELVKLPNVCFILAGQSSYNYSTGELTDINKIQQLIFILENNLIRGTDELLFKRYKRLQSLEDVKAEFFIHTL